MKYSHKQIGSSVCKSIYKFDGVDTVNHPAFAAENQMTECMNLWNERGILTTRPGMQTVEPALMKKSPSNHITRTFVKEINSTAAKGYTKICGIGETTATVISSLATALLKENGDRKEIDKIEFVSAMGNRQTEVINVEFFSATPINYTGIFMVVAMGWYTFTSSEYIVWYYELDNELQSWQRIHEIDLYTPVIFRYGRGNKYESVITQLGFSVRETEYLEKKNILNGAAEMYFNCDGFSDTFALPDEYKNYRSKYNNKIFITYSPSDSVTLDFSIPADSTVSKAQQLLGNSVIATFNSVNGEINFTVDGEPYALPNYGPNILKVRIYAFDQNKAFNIFSVRAKEAFCDLRTLRIGGVNDCGKIFYSGKNNPFYYYEEGYVAIGEPDKAITAMAMQNRYLFVFKENEIYRLKIGETQAYDVKEILKQSVGEKMPNLFYTLTMVHSTIGCDCPHTLRFCSNRLVWYHSRGAVYTVYGANTYTEGNVYELSVSIEKRIKKNISDKESAVAYEFNGYYYLYIDGEIFVMDTKVSGFAYLSGAKTPSTANGGMCWYIWKIPESIRVLTIFEMAGQMYIIVMWKAHMGQIFLTKIQGENDSYYDENNQIVTEEIKVCFASSLIEAKNLGKARLVAARINFAGENPAFCNLFTEKGEGKKIRILPEKMLKSYSIIPGFVKCESGGIKLNSSGKTDIYAIELEFRKER